MQDFALKAMLRELDAEPFSGDVWRVTDAERDPLEASDAPGRWDTGIPAIYTSLSPEGAIAEFRHANGGDHPHPVLHHLHVRARATLRLDYEILAKLGVARADYDETARPLCQHIGELAASLGFDSIVSPSARWPAENLVLFVPNADDGAIRLVRSDALAASELEVH
jgi:RES domain-containing protein